MKRNIVNILIPPMLILIMHCASNSNSEATNENTQDETGSPVKSLYTIGGTLSGLAAGNRLVLSNNATDELGLDSNGDFIFKIPQEDLTAYNVSVLTQPVGQICTVSQGLGTFSGSDINTVSVVCAKEAHTVGGNLSGLVSGVLMLQNNSGDNLALTSDGSFVFSSPVASGADFNVTIMTNPSGIICSVIGGHGIMKSANIDTVNVTCSPAMFTVGGNLGGLGSGQSIILDNNGSDFLTLNANGGFTFPLEIASGASYLVSINSQPAGQTCMVSNASGIASSENIISISINCTNNSYFVSGTVNGLAGSVTLQNNGVEYLDILSPGNFTFIIPVEYGTNYYVSVLSSPVGQVCSISNSVGTMGAADITNIIVDCVSAITIGGVLSGLANGLEITISLNTENLMTLKSNQSFNFNQDIIPGTLYNISIVVEPAGQVCNIINGSGIMSTTNITDVIVSCTNSLIINEIDYDNIGTDYSEYIEIYNHGNNAVNLAGYLLVLVNGLNNAVYKTYDLSVAGFLLPGQYLVVGASPALASIFPEVLKIDLGPVSNEIQNGSPDGVALVNNANATLADALAYEGQITSSIISGINGAVSLVEGVSLDTMVKDSTTNNGSLCRYPNGSDTNNSANDWTFCSMPTPGSLNIP